MTEIKVIFDQGTTLDLASLSNEERELIFEQLAEDNPNIPRHIIDSFADMQNEIIQETAKSSKPELKELLLRKVIQLSQNFGNDFNTIVIPIIPSFDNSTLKRPTKTGSAAIPPMRRLKPQEIVKKESVPHSIKIRFDNQILSVTSTGLDYIVPPNEELDVIGIIINPICNVPKILSKIELKKLDALNIDLPSVGNRIPMGNYTYNMAARACDDYFIKPDYSVTIAAEKYTDSTKIMFDDLDDTKISRILSAIFDYISSLTEYYKSLPAAEFVYAQLRSVLDGNTTSVKSKLVKDIKHLYEEHTIDSPSSKPGKIPDILKILETVHKGAFSTVYNEAMLADIDMRGFSRIWYKAQLKGKDDSSVKEQLAKYKERQSRLAFQNSVKAKLLDEQNKLNAYKTIIEKKLGSKRLIEVEHEISKKPSITVAAKNILDLLKPAERKPIQLEFERREKYLEAVINNKCPHVKIYRQFRLARDDEISRRKYNELSKFFKNPKETDKMIQCNNCGFDIICPHYKEFTELEFAGKFYADIKAKLTKYIDHAVVRDQYYCKICGEMISSLEAFGDIGQARDSSSNMNEELKNFMWGEMIILTKYLKFGNLINVPQLVTAMRDACYPYIFEIEKQILKSKTNSADEIKAKKRLFITIYAFAYMIHLILSNRSKSGDNEISFKNFKPKNPKNAIVDMIKHSLEIIILSRNVIIREIPGMTADLIKNKLIEAYKSMQSVGTQVITYSGEAEDLLITLVLDPVYKYLYFINTIDDILSGKRPSKSKYDLVKRIDDLMGDSIPKLEKSDNVFGKIHIPKFDTKWNLKAFDDIKPLTKAKAMPGGKSVWESAQAGYQARSFDIFVDKIRNKLYTQPMYIDVSAKKGDAGDAMDVKFREPFEAHNEKFAQMVDKEKILYQYKLMEFAKNYGKFPNKFSRRWSRPEVSLGRIYDEDGNLHNWSIYIIEKTVDDKASKVEKTASEIAKSTEMGTQFTDVISDRKCSVCGVLWSKSDTLSDDKIKDSLNSLYTVNNFFRFYENRCPKGALHDFDKSGKCTKCGIGNDYILKSSSKESMNYYREFRNIYFKERDEFASSTSISTTSALKPQDASAKYESEYTKWTFNFNVVIDLANKLKINQRLLMAMGAVEKQEYAEVQSGAYIPTEAEMKNDTRIYVLNTHIKNLITEYNQIRFFHKLVKPSIDLIQLIDNSGINKHKIADIGNKLPIIFNDYNNRFTYIQRNKKPRETVSFCIQTFCEMCLRIWNDNDKETERLRHDFVEYFVKKVVRAEELLSKPGHFNWSLLYCDKEIKEKDSYDQNYNDKLESEVDKEYEDTMEESDEFGDTGKPMGNNFDMDDADKEPGDDEDDDQGMGHVGEELGLD